MASALQSIQPTVSAQIDKEKFNAEILKKFSEISFPEGTTASIPVALTKVNLWKKVTIEQLREEFLEEDVSTICEESNVEEFQRKSLLLLRITAKAFSILVTKSNTSLFEAEMLAIKTKGFFQNPAPFMILRDLYKSRGNAEKEKEMETILKSKEMADN